MKKKRPPYFKAVFGRRLAFVSANLSNKLSPTTRKIIDDKLAFKEKISRLLRKIDVLDHNCIPTESLKIDQQIQRVIRESGEVFTMNDSDYRDTNDSAECKQSHAPY